MHELIKIIDSIVINDSIEEHFLHLLDLHKDLRNAYLKSESDFEKLLEQFKESECLVTRSTATINDFMKQKQQAKVLLNHAQQRNRDLEMKCNNLWKEMNFLNNFIRNLNLHDDEKKDLIAHQSKIQNVLHTKNYSFLDSSTLNLTPEDMAELSCVDSDGTEKVKRLSCSGDWLKHEPLTENNVEEVVLPCNTPIAEGEQIEELICGGPLSSVAGTNHISESVENLTKHSLATKLFMRADTCSGCQRKLSVGAVGLHCICCGILCHNICRKEIEMMPCPLAAYHGLSITGYIKEAGSTIPNLLKYCILELEGRCYNASWLLNSDINLENKIKVTELKLAFEMSSKTGTGPRLDDISVGVLCECIKDCLNSMKERLIPKEALMSFGIVKRYASNLDMKEQLFEMLKHLPKPKRDVLGLVVMHLKRMAAISPSSFALSFIECRYGPVLVDLAPIKKKVFREQGQLMHYDVCLQYKVTSELLKFPNSFWWHLLRMSNGSSTLLTPIRGIFNKLKNVTTPRESK